MKSKPGPQDDVDRLTRWVREHGVAVRGFLWGMVRDHHVTEDLLQEVFCRAWEGRDRYSEQQKERAYLLCIADRLAKDRARRSGKQKTLDSAEWLSVAPIDRTLSGEELLTAKEQERHLAAALDSLTEPQRRTLLLRYYGEMDFVEIAREMDCPTNTVLSHCRRGLAALRRLLVGESS